MKVQSVGQNYQSNKQNFKGKKLIAGPQYQLHLIADILYKKSLDNSQSLWMSPVNGRIIEKKADDIAIILTGTEANLADVYVSNAMLTGGVPGTESFAERIKICIGLSKEPQKTQDFLKELENPFFDFLTLDIKNN